MKKSCIVWSARSSLILLCWITVATSQIQAQQSANQTSRTDAINAYIKQEIARHPNGEYLYAHSEVFKHEIYLRVRNRFGRNSDGQTKIGQHKNKFEQPLGNTQSSVHDVSIDTLEQNETSIAISRRDPKLVVAGANDEAMFEDGMPAYTTTDGGITWNTYRLPQIGITPYESGGDPILTAGGDGTLFYAVLIYDTNFAYSNLIVGRSLDGINWTYGNPVMHIGPSSDFEDKESIAVDRDPLSQHYGRLYIVWMHYVMGGTTYADSMGLRLSWSDNQGISWSTPIALTGSDADFAQPVVGKNGVLFVSYSDPLYTQDSIKYQPEHTLLVSTDGGLRFTHHIIAPYLVYPMYGAYPTLKGQDGFRSYPYISFAVDNAVNNIYCVYGTYEHAGVDSVAGLYYVHSTDLGASWTSPSSLGVVGDVAAEDRFHPWVVFDQKTHTAFASYYSSQADPNNLQTGIYRATLSSPALHDNGIHSFLELDTALFNPLDIFSQFQSRCFIGDYMGTDADAGTFAAAWTEVRPSGTDGDVFVYVSDAASGVHRSHLPHAELEFGPISENPIVNGYATLSFSIPASGNVEITIFDEQGTIARQFANETFFSGKHAIRGDFSGLPSGSYLCRLDYAGKQAVQKIVLTK